MVGLKLQVKDIIIFKQNLSYVIGKIHSNLQTIVGLTLQEKDIVIFILKKGGLTLQVKDIKIFIK